MSVSNPLSGDDLYHGRLNADGISQTCFMEIEANKELFV